MATDLAAALLRSRSAAIRRRDGFHDLLATVRGYLSDTDVQGITEAYVFSAGRHEGQVRISGAAYITHPVAVARILADLHLDASTIMAALLHDVVEDTRSTIGEIRARFGDDVALLVDGVSKLDRMRFDTAAEAQAESFRKMLLAMAKDLRVILVKLADRTHNMRTIDALPLEKQRRIARETLDIYAPIANRLGMYSLKVELQEIGFRVSYPVRYEILERALGKLSGGQKTSLKKIASRIRKSLGEHGIESRVLSRKKNLYSIYKKMQRKRAHLSEIVDVFGIRIIVGEVEECYRALGIVHLLFKPMPGRFKDYIAIPRVNGYQSLHTTLFGIGGAPLEVQIRTEEMDKVAERGIAANWQYKAVDKKTNGPEQRARAWLAGLMEMQQAANSEEFLETVRVDLFPDTVYVFTPKGDIMRLPRGATVIDFAYAVHTDVGNRCTAATIDRRRVPLNTVLSNGETVEIVTERRAQPNPGWVSFVITAKARNAIRAHLKRLKRDEAQDLGKQLMEQALLPYSLKPKKLPKSIVNPLLEDLDVESLEALYERIGLGELLAPVIAGRLAIGTAAIDPGSLAESKPLYIAGGEGFVLTYAGCCYPIPGDEIVGFMSKGRGLVIHRAECRNLAEFRNDPSKWIPVDWKSKPNGEFLTEIHVYTIDRVGVLAEVAGKISAVQSNIDFVRVDTESDAAVQVFRLKVRDRKHLAQVMRGLRKVSGVSKVVRHTS
jgi:guanosine-3',5'-bis(diphosphate) 3'-pyrophosphohydrolase